MESCSTGEVSPSLFHLKGKKKSLSSYNHKAGASRSVQGSVPPCSWPGGTSCPQACVLVGKSSPSCGRNLLLSCQQWPWHRGVSAASGTWPCCKVLFWETPFLCSSPRCARGQEVALQEETHNRHILVCPSLMPPRSPGRTALSPVSLVRLFLVPNEFP